MGNPRRVQVSEERGSVVGGAREALGARRSGCGARSGRHQSSVVRTSERWQQRLLADSRASGVVVDVFW